MPATILANAACFHASARAYLVQILIISAVLFFATATLCRADPNPQGFENWRTDFTRIIVKNSEILSGGPPKDGIPAIDNPKFITVAETKHLNDVEPVIAFEYNGDARAYPLQVLMWHEIVNDIVGGEPFACLLYIS